MKNTPNGHRSVLGQRQADSDMPSTRRITTKELFAGARELWIVHEGEAYRLTITRNGKLILTK